MRMVNKRNTNDTKKLKRELPTYHVNENDGKNFESCPWNNYFTKLSTTNDKYSGRTCKNEEQTNEQIEGTFPR